MQHNNLTMQCMYLQISDSACWTCSMWLPLYFTSPVRNTYPSFVIRNIASLQSFVIFFFLYDGRVYVLKEEAQTRLLHLIYYMEMSNLNKIVVMTLYECIEKRWRVLGGFTIAEILSCVFLRILHNDKKI